MAHRTSLRVNGKLHTVDADPRTPLLYVLHDTLGLNNPKFGCGLGQCGACTVLIDNHATRSCLLPVSDAAGKEIITLEGLGSLDAPHPIQQAFINEQALQCGYCLNGWILSAKELLDNNPAPSDAEIAAAFAGLVCRCGSHLRILRAVHHAAANRRKA